MNPETKIQNAIMLALSEAGCTVWRVETAGAWVGRIIHRERDTVTLASARMFTTGLCKGGSDIIGIAPDGRFMAIEVKTNKGKPTQEQVIFIDIIRKSGGIAGIARSPAEALELLADNNN